MSIPVPKWLQRLILRWDIRDCKKMCFALIAMGKDNGNAQTFLNAAKDNLWLAARELELEKDKI